MSINIPANILGLSGQRVNEITRNNIRNTVHVLCKRDKRRKAIDPVTGKQGTINRYVRRQVKDIPLFGYPCYLEIELAQVFIDKNERRIEACDFVDKGCRFTQRFCHLVSGLSRHLSIQAVARHLEKLTGLKYIGVDEVARAKGHDYMTVVYDMVAGHLIWVGTGRTAEVFSDFLTRLPRTTAEKIEAVAMDMGPSYQKSVRVSIHMVLSKF